MATVESQSSKIINRFLEKDFTSAGKSFFARILIFVISQIIISSVINEHIFSLDGFLEQCVSVIVCARIMTEGGL